MKHAQASAILNGAGWKYLSCFLFIQSEYNLDKPSSDVCRRRRCRRHYRRGAAAEKHDGCGACTGRKRRREFCMCAPLLLGGIKSEILHFSFPIQTERRLPTHPPTHSAAAPPPPTLRHLFLKPPTERRARPEISGKFCQPAEEENAFDSLSATCKMYSISC